MTSLRQFRLAQLLFFGSGCCALAYETVWVRQLTLSFGISVHAVSAVLSAYMFGLCVGAYALGRWSHRVRNPLRIYAYFELAIVAYTLLLYFVLADFVPNLYRVGYGALPDARWVLTLAKFAVTFVLLAIPTTLMGGTLPILSVFLKSGDEELGAAIGRLYGINTLGGAVGTALAGFWLLKDLGILATTAVTLIVNLAIALTAFWFSREAVPARPPETRTPARIAARAERPTGAGLVSLVLLLSGYTALSYEVIWNRSLLLYTHNSTYAFSTILIVFLFGTSLGSLLYGVVPRRWTGMRALGAVQLALALFVWISIPLTGMLPPILSRVTGFLGIDSWFAAMSTIAVSAIAIVFVPTIMMGFTFPAATALLASKRDEIGAVTGRAYAFLTIGNILGTIVTGFALIEWLGLRDAFAVAIFLNLVGGFSLIAYRPGSFARLAAAPACAAAALALFLVTVDRDVYRSYYEKFLHKIIFYKEEVTDNVLVWEDKRGNREIFYSDGRGTAGTKTNFTNRLSGHIPMLLHSNPRSVLSICFGVGNTLSALAAYQPDELVCVELSPGAIEAARFFPTNRNVTKTANLEIEIEDGRNFLLRAQRDFDVIQLEPPELHQSSVVNLYTREFYELARSHLREGGIICQWFSTLMPEYERKMVIRTFLDVFPEASLWSGSNLTSLVLIGSTSPIRVEPEGFRARAELPAVRADLRRLGVSALDVMARHLMGPASLAEYAGEVSVITDDRTYIDFSIPRSSEAGFGVFIYNTYQERGSPEATRMFHKIRLDSLHLHSRAESPDYLFDYSGADPEVRGAFLEELEASVVRHRRAGGAEYHRRLGVVLAEDGKLEEAEVSVRESLRLDPLRFNTVLQLGRLLWRRGDLAGAEAQLELALDLNPANPRARAQLRKLKRDLALKESTKRSVSERR